MCDLGTSFAPNFHPEVQSGRKKSQDVLAEFFRDINSISSTGYISFDQFVEYYENVAAFFDDNQFERIVKSVWKPSAAMRSGSPAHLHHRSERKLSEVLNHSKPSNDLVIDSLETYLPSLQQMKLALKSRGFYGVIQLCRAFRSFDSDGRKLLNLAEFKAALRECNLGLSEMLMNNLFTHFDRDRVGEIRFMK